MTFNKLLAPGKIGTLELRNRIVMPSVGLSYSSDNSINERWVSFYEERARGGVGLMIIPAMVEFTGEKGYESLTTNGKLATIPSLGDDKYLPGWRNLVEAAHRHGAKVGAQLVHVGKYAHSSDLNGVQPVSASAVQANLTMCGLPGEIPRELTVPEIHLIQRNIANTALRARSAGIDLVELNVSSGYLLREFLSPLTNKRTDAYGGNLERRMLFLLELIRMIRNNVGRDYPLMVRLSADEFLPGGHTLEESRQVAQALEKAGIDAISVVGGGHETTIPLSPMSVPRGAFVYLARGIKEVVSIPVIASARINNPSIAEDILRDEQADFVAIARGMLADPDFANKARDGKADDIRPCIACNQGCFDKVFEWKPVSCLMNPRVGYEQERQITPAETKKKVMVIGGGPAGMEAAEVLAMRGHSVFLYEKENRLGGQVNLAALPPDREELGNIPLYFRHRLDDLGVHVILGQQVDARLIASEKPDAIVVATGAEPSVPDLPGMKNDKVITSWDALQDHQAAGRRVVVLGGGSVGCESAIHLAKKGAMDAQTYAFLSSHGANLEATQHSTKGNRDVTVIEARARIGQDFGKGNRWVFMADIKRLGIKVLTNAEVKSITDAGVIVKIGEQEQLIPADTVVLALGSRSNRRLYEAIKENVGEVHLIGDAQRPRTIHEAMDEGLEVACRI